MVSTRRPARAGVESVGVCYGMVGNDLPPPTAVVKLYKSLGINRMRIYAPDTHVLGALRGSGIRLVLGVANEDLAANRASAASWVRANVKPYNPAVRIAYVAAGNEVQGGAARSILPAMRNLAAALAAAGLAGVKVSTCVRLDVVASSFPPSGGVFAQPYMADIARFLAAAGAPLLANVYPYFAYKEDPRSISLGYATVVVSESGWPSAGGFAASVENARAYNQGVVEHSGKGKGTPKRPGAALEAYVFAMFNENQKPGDPTEKSFGLFHPNKSAVSPIRFR
ncbi:hypothetical protein PVAP13_5KG759100 [Panicum virgatum]|uniref:Uncharacterized protein n=1 Tax=Panicum virgatum TaxID=38727 RepID=A0A8T0SUJ2_PANVG|nr:hypothetical protein PVAP13_5KG759100 [Panicum virgatum]